jgi:spermidine/putrescine transport system substrate-binding protein
MSQCAGTRHPTHWTDAMRTSPALAFVAVLLATASLAACSPAGNSSSAGNASPPPVLFEWEDYIAPPMLAEYEKTYSETPQTAIYTGEDEAFAKMLAGYQPDVIGPCSYELPRWREAGLIQPIDTTKLKNWEKIAPVLRELPDLSAGDNKVWFVPHYWGNTSITYRKDLAPEYASKESWNILFDPKYKGRVAVLDGADDTVPFIAHMMGIDPYNTISEADWTKLQAKLRELMKQVRFVSSDNTSLEQGLASGELVAAMSWRIVFAQLQDQGVKVGYMNPPGGIFKYACGLVIHKNAKSYEKSLALVDSMLSDEAAHYGLEKIGDGPANISIMKDEPEAVLQRLGVPRDVDAFLKGSGILQLPMKDKDKIVKAWSTIKSGL